MKAKKIVAKTLAAIALKSAKTACGAASCFGSYQPKEPARVTMNTIKRSCLGIAYILCISALTACTNQPTVESVVSSTDISGNNISSIEQQASTDSSVIMVREQYNVTLPVLTADSALELTKIKLPKQIEGHSFSINGLIYDKTFVVSLFDLTGATGIDHGTGLYDIENNEYYALPELPPDGYCAWNNNYIVFKEYNSDFTTSADDESVKLYLYDINACQRKLIYTYSFDRNTELYEGHWRNNIVLSNNKVYFDDIISEDNDSGRHACLFSYDIPSGKIEKLDDDAQNPIIYNDTLLYIKTSNNRNKVHSINGEYDFDMNGYVQAIIPMENSIFSLDALSSDDIKQETTWGIKNMITDECILKTTRTISDPTSSDSFMAFTDYGINYPPIVYSAKNNSFIVFNDLNGMNVTWYFYNDVGAVRVIDDEETVIYMFTLK